MAEWVSIIDFCPTGMRFGEFESGNLYNYLIICIGVRLVTSRSCASQTTAAHQTEWIILKKVTRLSLSLHECGESTHT